MEDNLGAGLGAGAKSEGNNGDEDSIIYLPLTDFNGKLLPIHFLVGTEVYYVITIIPWLAII